VKIYDAGGHLVDVMDLGPSSAGSYELDWDGTDSRGEQVADGAYSYKVEALNSFDNDVVVDYRIYGKVTGVSFEDGLALLTLDKYVAADVGSVMSVL
jgi:flagellar basal-body rod modification protein FlgD